MDAHAHAVSQEVFQEMFPFSTLADCYFKDADCSQKAEASSSVMAASGAPDCSEDIRSPTAR